MPTPTTITPRVLEYLALVALGLIVTTFLVTRIFYVRRIAKSKAATRALEREVLELHGKIKSTETRPAPAGRIQQLVAIIVAIGSLSALVAASTQFLHEFLNSESCTTSLAQSKNTVSKLKGVLTFDENSWKVAEDSVFSVYKPKQDETFVLGQHRIDNSAKSSIKVTYDGLSPAMIDSDRTVTISIKLQTPSTGVRLLVRPIRAPSGKK